MARISPERYKNYMTSDEWRTKRLEYINSPLHLNNCFGCGKLYESSFHLHHASYANFENEALEDLRMVCILCHDIIHNLERNQNFTLLAATNKVRELYFENKIKPEKKKKRTKQCQFKAALGGICGSTRKKISSQEYCNFHQAFVKKEKLPFRSGKGKGARTIYK